MEISPQPTFANARLVPRRIGRRVVFMGLMLLPLLFVVGAVLEPASALIFLVAALVLAAPLALAIAYELSYRLWVSDEGVEVRALSVSGMKHTALAFDDIERVYVTAVDPSQGGSSLVEAGAELLGKLTAPKDGSLNELTTSITIALHGAGNRKLKLTTGNKGVTAVLRTVVENTMARLQAATLDALDDGASVSFGPYTLEPAGVRWRGTLMAWDEIDTFDVDDGGKLVLKKSGAWLAKANPSAHKVPNLDVLLAVVNEKRAQA